MIKEASVVGQASGAQIDFRIGFLDAEGSLIQSVSLRAESLSTATAQAAEIAGEINAANFFITATPKVPARGASDLPTIAKLLAFLRRNSSLDVDTQKPSADLAP